LDGLPICTQCGFTWAEYRARGLLGCPHCYSAFGEALQGDLLWIHRAFEHLVPGGAEDPASRAERIAHLREQFADALRKEDYAEAARLRRLIDGSGNVTTGGDGPRGTGSGSGGRLEGHDCGRDHGGDESSAG
jgi:protein arginine kinase activator